MTRRARRLAPAAVMAVFAAVFAAACSGAETQEDRDFPRNAAEFDALFHEVSNWGRWGADDQLGTFNLITPGKRRRWSGAASAFRSRATR